MHKFIHLLCIFICSLKIQIKVKEKWKMMAGNWRKQGKMAYELDYGWMRHHLCFANTDLVEMRLGLSGKLINRQLQVKDDFLLWFSSHLNLFALKMAIINVKRLISQSAFGNQTQGHHKSNNAHQRKAK